MRRVCGKAHSFEAEHKCFMQKTFSAYREFGSKAGNKLYPQDLGGFVLGVFGKAVVFSQWHFYTLLGNILLNILVPPNMPCSRTGKNNVLIVCIPNPPIDEKNATVPVPVLIRVKTSEDADELHNILAEKKEA